MLQETLVGLTTQALYLVLILSMPAIAVASIVGVVVALAQALTQVQEQTLNFAVKLLAIIIALIATANWLGVTLYDYAIRLFDLIPEI